MFTNKAGDASMIQKSSLTVLSLLLTISVIVCAQESPKLSYDLPKGWVEQETTSRMRYAQFKLPKAGGAEEDASLVVYYFAGGGGGVQANFNRWKRQIKQQAGEKTETFVKEFKGKKTHFIKMNGTYSPPPFLRQGGPKKGYRMVGAIMETKAGPFFFKILGPKGAVTKHEGAFDEFLASVKVK